MSGGRRRLRLAYYAHHHGTGHLRHAQNIASLDLVDLLVTSTGPRDANLLPGPTEYVPLEPDVGDDGAPLRHAAADGFHYAPDHPAIRRRFAGLSRAWAEFGADAVLVDVSVEAAVFARLSGYPVVYRRMPGDRTDAAHRTAYGVASRLVAYFPSALEDPAHLSLHGGKSDYLGMLAPDAAGTRGTAPAGAGSRRRVVVQTSLGGGVGLAGIERAARAAPGWDWQVAGRLADAKAERDDDAGVDPPDNLEVLGVVADPGALLAGADVVVTSAGHNAIAAAAAAGRPTVVVPEERPFGEQAAFAGRLAGIPGTVSVPTWDAVDDWEALLDRLARGPGSGLADALFTHRDAFRESLDVLLRRAVSQPSSP